MSPSRRKSHTPPTVIRQELHWVPKGRRVVLDHEEHPYRVWTVYTHMDPNVRPDLPMTPVHNQGVFLEDCMHDWRFILDPNKDFGSVLKYYSRLREYDVWLLVEFCDPKENPYTRERR